MPTLFDRIMAQLEKYPSPLRCYFDDLTDDIVQVPYFFDSGVECRLDVFTEDFKRMLQALKRART